MSDDAAGAMKARLRGDLRTAMAERRVTETNVIRALLAALDNAEAPPAESDVPVHQKAAAGSTEVQRLLLSDSDVRQALLAEVQERERAAEDLERRGRPDHAAELRAEALIASRYTR